MTLVIRDPALLGKIERAAEAEGLSGEALVERAVDGLLGSRPPPGPAGSPAEIRRRLSAVLRGMEGVEIRPPDRDPLDWDERGAPR